MLFYSCLSQVLIIIIIMPHSYAKHKMWFIVTDVPLSVCLCVCLSVCLLLSRVNPTKKTTEPIEVLFGV